jgi:CBS domain containing-hemolysin-like protein
VIERLGRVPRKGETLQIDRARLRVSEVEDPHVTDLMIDRLEASEEEDSS